MYSVFQVAKWFLNKDKYITNKKLQKLCWYAYSWYIALNYDPEDNKELAFLINEKAEAWVHGPVFKILYEDIKYNNSQQIYSSNDITAKDDISFLNQVYDVYGNNSGYELENFTHQELPWINARVGYKPYEACHKIIKDEDILTEYLPRLSGE